MYTRREFGRLAAAGLSASLLPLSDLWAVAKIDSTYKGVKLGLITGSLNPLPAGADPIDTIVQECVQLGVGYVEFVRYAAWSRPFREFAAAAGFPHKSLLNIRLPARRSGSGG